MNIITLAGNFKSIKELQDYCNQQYTLLHATLEKAKQLEEEVNHLKELLASSTQIINESPEKDICETQLRMLQDEAKKRPLTLAETKILDLLVKNLYLSTGKSTQQIDLRSLNVSEGELISLAGKENV